MFDDLKAADFIQVGIFLVGGLVFILTMKGELKVLAHAIKVQGKQLEAQAEELKQLTLVIKDQAVMHERMNAFDKQLDDIRHWRGFVNPSGEYSRTNAKLFADR